MKKLEIELVKGVAQTPRWMRTIVRTLGLRRRHQKVLMPNNGAIQGMVRKVSHLVVCKEVEG